MGKIEGTSMGDMRQPTSPDVPSVAQAGVHQEMLLLLSAVSQVHVILHYV